MGMYKKDSTQLYTLSSPPQTSISILEKIHYWCNKLLPSSASDTKIADNFVIFELQEVETAKRTQTVLQS